MRLALAILLLARAAHADVTKLGDFALGQEVKKPTTVKVKLYGCTGELRPTTDRKKKVTRVRYEATACTLASAAAAITKQLGAPISNPAGDRLWEGKTASLVMTNRGGNAPLILLVAPATKRVCFPGDGFAAFWTDFKTAVANGKRNAIAASFAFPLKSFDGKVVIANAADFIDHYAEHFDAADLKAIAGGTSAAECKLAEEHYLLRLDSSNAELLATRIRGTWKWTSRNEVSPD